MPGGERIEVGGRRLGVSDHAAERYHERVGVRFETVEEARADLLRLVGSFGRIVRELPPWASSELPNTGVVMVGEDIVFPINDAGVLRTCIAHGHLPEETRKRRSQARRSARAGRRSIRWAKRAHGEGPGYVGGRGI